MQDRTGRVLHALAAESCAVFHAQTPGLLRRLAAWATDPAGTDDFPREQLDQHRRGAAQLLRQLKELRK